VIDEGEIYDLSSSREISAYRIGNELKLFNYYFDYNQQYIKWTEPTILYNWTYDFDFEPNLEVEKRVDMEFLGVRDGNDLYLKRRVIGDFPIVWTDVGKMNLLDAFYFDLSALRGPIDETTPEHEISFKVAVAYVAGDDQRTVVFKRRDFTKTQSIISTPTLIDFPGYGQVNMIRTGDGITHLVWSEEGQIWYTWTDKNAEGWTGRIRVTSGWSPTLLTKPDSSGFYLLYLKEKLVQIPFI